ncbi:MAG: hypothetical protein WBA13_23020 [Microcoleaceae cyanobacterium]
MISNQQQSYFPVKTDSSESLYPITGAVAGAALSTTVGNIGLVGSFGGVAVSSFPVIIAGSVVGCAAYGGKEAIKNSDVTALFSTTTGAAMGAGISNMIGGIGVSAGGAAIGIGTISLSLVGGIAGLGVYGTFKLLDKMGNGETAIEAFDRIEEQIIEADFYGEALLEVMELINPEIALEEEFKALEIEEELQQLKANLKNRPQIQQFQCKIEIQGCYDYHPHVPINPQTIQREIMKSLTVQLTDSNIRLLNYQAEEIWVKPSDNNNFRNQYRSPEFSKIVDFKLTILLMFSSDQIKPETLKTILSQNIIIEEISNLIQLKNMTILD